MTQKFQHKKLAELIRVHYGKALKANDRDESGQNIVFGSSGEVGKHSSALVAHPTLVIGRKGSVGEVTYAPDGGWPIDTAFYTEMIDEKKIDLRYLFYALRRANLARHTITTSIPGLSRDDIYRTTIPLPPLPEQRRIAAILDKADAVRRKRQEAIKLTEEFLRSVFLDMFGDPVTNPKVWEVVPLESFCTTQLGKMLSPKAKTGKNPVPYLRNASVQWRHFDLAALPEMDFNEKELEKFNLIDGDTLVCEGGEVGRCAIWKGQLTLCSFQKALHRVRLDPKKATSEYIQEYFYWMAQLGGLSDSTSQATIAHLTGVKLKQLPVPLPPMSSQHQFSDLYHYYQKTRRRIENRFEDLDDLFNRLSSDAFTDGLNSSVFDKKSLARG